MQATINEMRWKKEFATRPCAFEHLWDEDRFDTLDTEASHTTEGHVGTAVVEGEITGYVVFRGSESDEKDNQDWFSNFDFKLVTPEKNMVPTTDKLPVNGMVHSGFLNGWREVKVRVLEKVEKFDRIVVTGHSRGAGIATICHENLLFRFPNKKIYLVALSCPPTGNRYFIETSRAKSRGMYHFWYGDDSIVRGPQAYLIQAMMGYIATPMESHIDKDRRLPWNWIPKITSWPWDHWPDTLQIKMREAMIKVGIKIDDMVMPGHRL